VYAVEKYVQKVRAVRDCARVKFTFIKGFHRCWSTW